MDALGNQTNRQHAALVMFAFLQADCSIRNSEYSKELRSLDQEISYRDINHNSSRRDVLDEGHLETDGHLPRCISLSLDGLQPSVELRQHGNHAGAAAFRQVAQELRAIADQLEHNIVAQATQNLSRNILASPTDAWKEHLWSEVDKAMRQGVSLQDLPQERVVIALTLTLVKGVCEHSPRLLRNLFTAALQYICHAWTR